MYAVITRTRAVIACNVFRARNGHNIVLGHEMHHHIIVLFCQDMLECHNHIRLSELMKFLSFNVYIVF